MGAGTSPTSGGPPGMDRTKVPESFARDFRRFFIQGLVAVLPTLLTIAIVMWVCRMVHQFVGQYINVLAKWFVVQFNTLYRLASGEAAAQGPWWRVLVGSDRQWQRAHQIWQAYHLGWVGFVLAFVVIYILGRFVASFLGKGVVRFLERALLATPVIKQIYPGVKQVTDFLLSERKMEVSRVVAVEYPRKGCWSIGLVTAPGMRTLQEANDGSWLTVFIPSSPTPVTGYTITVRREEVIDLPIHIDDALRFTVSGGVIMPPSEVLSQAELKRAALGALPQPAQAKESEE